MNESSRHSSALQPVGRIARRGLAALLLLPFFCVGCEQHPHAARQPEPELGPEERLDLVFERFKSRCTTTDTTLSIPDEGAHRQRMRVKVEFDNITHQLHAPTSPDGKYTAEITVQSSTYLSVLTPTIPEEEKTETEGETIPTDDAVDPLSAGEHKRRLREVRERIAAERPESIPQRDQHTETYDLAYENERWVLKSQNLDPSVQLMFDYALAVQ